MSSSPRGLAPREGLEPVLMKMGCAGLPLSHALGRRQASLGTPVPRTPTVAPRPKVRSGLASPRIQVQARLRPGATVGVMGTGVPRLACLRPTAWLKGGPSAAHLHQHKPKTLARCQASWGGRRGASSGTASSGWLTRRWRDQGRVPHEVPVTQAMTTKGAWRAPARAVSSFPLWCKGGKRSRGVPRHQAKVAILVQQDQD